MAQRDKLRGLLRPHDTRQLRNGERVALFHLTVADQRGRGRSNTNTAASGCRSLRYVFFRDIDHDGISVGVEMGQRFTHRNGP